MLALSYFTGTDLTSLSGGGGGGGVETTDGPVQSTPQEERMVDFVDAVASDTQAAWSGILGPRYEQTRVVLFRDAIQSACGFAESATRRDDRQ